MGDDTTSHLISTFRAEDERIGSAVRYLVAVPHDAAKTTLGPISYRHTRDPDLIEKMNYGLAITDQVPKPVVTVSDEDVQVMNAKAWEAKLRDFNDWVGTYFKPEDNPAAKKVMMEVYPEWFEMQTKEIDDWHDMKKRIEKIKIKGPESKEDLFLLYRLIGGGEITDDYFKAAFVSDAAPGLAKRGEGWTKSGYDPEANFTRGIWSTRKVDLMTQALEHGVLQKRTAGSWGEGTDTSRKLALAMARPSGFHGMMPAWRLKVGGNVPM